MSESTLNSFVVDIPERLQNFDLSRKPRRAEPRRELLRHDSRFDFNALGIEGCQPFVRVANRILGPKFVALRECHDKGQSIARYNDILDTINGMLKDWRLYLTTVWECSDFTPPKDLRIPKGWHPDQVVEFKPELLEYIALEEYVRLKRDSLTHVFEEVMPIESLMTAKFMSEHKGKYGSALATDFQYIVEAFAQSCSQSLLELVNLYSVGFVQWYPDANCRYVYFRREIVSEVTERCRGSIVPKKGRTVVNVWCHDHHLTNAYCCHPNNKKIKIPDRHQRIINECPSWLFDQLDLVVGSMTMESISHKYYEDREWKMNDFFHCLLADPGILIGPYVLTGWSPRDVGEAPPAYDMSEEWMGTLKPKPRRFDVRSFVSKALGG